MGDVPARTRRDACPGALQVHEAADGALARLRIPGGRLSSPQLTVIADCAEVLGSGVIGLTSRANLQVRGLTAPADPENRDLTARGDLDRRGSSPAEAFAARIAEAGLLPSPTHERVRNIVASPLSGRGPSGRADVALLVEALDRALCAEPHLAELPGRFLFAVDDGSGDVADLGADLTWTPDGLLIAGVPLAVPPAPAEITEAEAATGWPPSPGAVTGNPLGNLGALREADHSPLAPPAGSPSPSPPDAVAAVMVAAALAFMEERRVPQPPLDSASGLPRNRRLGARDSAFVEQDGGSSGDVVAGAWRIAELTDGPARIAARLGGTLRIGGAARARETATRSPGVRRAGRVAQRDGRVALEVLVPLGRLSPAQARALAEAAEQAGVGAVVVTPWRSVVLLDLEASVAEETAGRLAAEGLVTDPESPWTGVTACTGRPGCAKSLADVQADAARWVTERDTPPPLPVHWSGCERRCGRPRGYFEDRVATTDGYATGRDGRMDEDDERRA